MILSRRSMLKSGLGGMGAFTLLSPLHAAMPAGLIATTGHGKLRGVMDKGVCSFRGIPYGGSVSVPERRFLAPPPVPSWTGIRDATRYGAQAMQRDEPTIDEPPPAEDCLFLNIWTPAADHARRPVMFYSHGGGFAIGSGGRIGQNGANLAREQDVVVVESNHRLGIFGYLYLGELLGPEYQGNQGMLDIVAALRWVNENIGAFGGDPHNVMIFGESGGGAKTACLYTMPSAAPYFNKASIESAGGPGGKPADATEVARRAMKALDLTDPRKLLEVPAGQLLRFQLGQDIHGAPGAAPASRMEQPFGPIVDGVILPETPFKKGAPAVSARKPLIVGGTKDEAVFFHLGDPSSFKLDEAGLRERLRPRLGDRTEAWIETFRRSRPGSSPSQLLIAIETSGARAQAVGMAEKKAEQNTAPVYSYILGYRTANKVPGTDFAAGAPHASDIALKFDNTGTPPPPIWIFGVFSDRTAARKKAARNMSAFWANFARTGKPSAPGQPVWESYTLAARKTMLIDAESKLVSDPEGDERRFWESEPTALKMFP